MPTRPVMKVGNNFPHCGLVTPYGHIERVTIRSGNGLRHQTIAWANVDLSSARWSDIHPKFDFTKDTSATNINVAWNYSSKISFKSPTDQYVKVLILWENIGANLTAISRPTYQNIMNWFVHIKFNSVAEPISLQAYLLIFLSVFWGVDEPYASCGPVLISSLYLYLNT